MTQAHQSTSNVVLVAVSDVFFYTKVRDALLSRGYVLERARSQEDIHAKTVALSPRAIILNMNDEKLHAFQALEQIRQDSRFAHLPILAFANHEEVDTWRRARDLGVSKIVSRNEFSARTLSLVEEVISGRSSDVGDTCPPLAPTP